MIRRQLRRLLLSKVLGGDIRRWMIYIGGSFAVRQLGKVVRPTPELIYQGKLRRGQQLAMATSRPLPRRLRTKAVRKALEASSRDDLRAVRAARKRRG